MKQKQYDYKYFTANIRTSVIFLVGSAALDSAAVHRSLKDEQILYSDLIFADDLVEGYDNLTLKTLYTLKFFMEIG